MLDNHGQRVLHPYTKLPLSFTWRYHILNIKKTDSASPLLPPNTFVILPSPSCPHNPTLYPTTHHPSHLAKRPFQHHPTCSTLSSLYLPVPPTPPYPLPHALISLLPHICSIPFHTIRILSEPHKSTPRHQDMELSISKLSTSPSFNPQVSAPLCLLSFPTVQESGTPPLFAHQGAAPVLPCPGSCLSLELSLDAPPQETIQSPPFKQVVKSTLSHLGPCLSLELCLGVPPPDSVYPSSNLSSSLGTPTPCGTPCNVKRISPLLTGVWFYPHQTNFKL